MDTYPILFFISLRDFLQLIIALFATEPKLRLAFCLKTVLQAGPLARYDGCHKH